MVTHLNQTPNLKVCDLIASNFDHIQIVSWLAFASEANFHIKFQNQSWDANIMWGQSEDPLSF